MEFSRLISFKFYFIYTAPKSQQKSAIYLVNYKIKTLQNYIEANGDANVGDSHANSHLYFYFWTKWSLFRKQLGYRKSEKFQ